MSVDRLPCSFRVASTERSPVPSPLTAGASDTEPSCKVRYWNLLRLCQPAPSPNQSHSVNSLATHPQLKGRTFTGTIIFFSFQKNAWGIVNTFLTPPPLFLHKISLSPAWPAECCFAALLQEQLQLETPRQILSKSLWGIAQRHPENCSMLPRVLQIIITFLILV